MRRAAKKDLNHNDIAGHLRSLGWSVLDLSRAGNGIPDMAVGRLGQKGQAALIEVKRGEKSQLTEREQWIKDRWDGPYLIVTSPQDAQRQLEDLWGA
jgi:hypothetical protein